MKKMFKISTNIILLAKHEAANFTKLQSIRNRTRKPISLGTAKSKLFRIPKRPVIPEDERLEFLRIYNSYRTAMKSLRYHFIINHSAEFAEISEDPEESKKIFDEDFKRCMAINDEWNLKQKEFRERAINEAHEEAIAKTLEKVESENAKIEEQKKFIEVLVKKEKEQSKTFITAENIDAAIEHALANPVDYNFALNLDGEKIVGRDTKEKDKISLSQ